MTSRSPAVPSYRVVAIGAVDAGAPQYVVDTNVVSHVEALLRGGQPTIQSEKAASLCQVLSDHPEIKVIDDFAWIEGSAFNQPHGLNPTSLVLRDLATKLLADRPADLLATTAAIEGWVVRDNYEEAVRASLDEAIPVMLVTVVPCYLAALVLEQRHRGVAPAALSVADVIAVLTVLSQRLNYVPGVLAAVLRLACVGTPSARQAAMGVLKTGRCARKSKAHLPVQNALSAAWDIGVMQLLSVKLAFGINAALVTEDSALASLTEMVTVSNGVVAIAPGFLDYSQQMREASTQLDLAHWQLRHDATPQPPAAAAAAAVVREAEAALGVASALPSALENGIRVAFPALVFGSADIDRVSAMLRTAPDSERRDAFDDLISDDLDDLRAHFDATVVISNCLVEMIASAQAIPAEQVVKPLTELSMYGADLARVVLAFVWAHERPFTATVYRELLRRPSTVKGKLVGFLGAVYQMVNHWAPVLAVEHNALVGAAARSAKALAEAASGSSERSS